jgi:glycosyltransferase involved in cell wall biosynthesis
MNLRFSVIVPTKNEYENLLKLKDYVKFFDEIIFIDGGSTDLTVSGVRRLFPSAHLIAQKEFVGKGSAIMLGLINSTGDFTIILDADAPVSVEEVVNIINVCSASTMYDLVKTSRSLPGGGSSDLTWIRRIGVRIFALIVRKFFHTNLTEVNYGFWAVRNLSLTSINLSDLLYSPPKAMRFLKTPYGHGFEFDQVLFLRFLKAKLKIHEIPSFELSRSFGSSKLFAPIDGVRTIIVIIYERFFND